MSGLRKGQIVGLALAGIRLNADDLVSIKITPRGAVMTLRHVWPEGIDGRISDAVHKAINARGAILATAIGRPVEAYAREGWQWGAWEPWGA